MCEHCSDGSVIWASIHRLAAYSKLTDRYVTELIQRFRERRVLTQLAPENTGKRRPATYRMNECALTDDPRMQPYRSGQLWLVGVPRKAVPGEPVELVNPVHQSGELSSGGLVNSVQGTGEHSSPDSKAFDSGIDSKSCLTCGGIGKLHQVAHIPGPRLIACPDCSVQEGASA